MKHPLHCGLVTLGPFHLFVFLCSASGPNADDHRAGNSAGVFWMAARRQQDVCACRRGGHCCHPQRGPTPVSGLWHLVLMLAVPLAVFAVKTGSMRAIRFPAFYKDDCRERKHFVREGTKEPSSSA